MNHKILRELTQTQLMFNILQPPTAGYNAAPLLKHTDVMSISHNHPVPLGYFTTNPFLWWLSYQVTLTTSINTPTVSICYHDLWISGLHPSLPSCALHGTFAPRPGLIHTATLLRPGELKALFVCSPWEILTLVSVLPPNKGSTY